MPSLGGSGSSMVPSFPGMGGSSGSGMSLPGMSGGKDGGSGMPGMGSLSKIGKKIFGDKPVVPEFVKLDAQKEQMGAVKGNLGALPGATALGEGVNTFNFNQLQQMLKAAIPQFDNMMNQGSANIMSQLRGEIPDPVKDQIARQSAQRSLYGGFGAGSGMGKNLEARDLGLNSMALLQQGTDAASRWMTSAKANALPQMFDVTSMFLTPQQQIGITAGNNEGQFQRDWLENKIAAAPDPTYRGIYDTVMTLVGAAAQVYSGGMTKPYNSNAVAGGTGGMYMNYSTPPPNYSSPSVGGWASNGNAAGLA